MLPVARDICYMLYVIRYLEPGMEMRKCEM